MIPPDKDRTMLENFKPSPVRVTTPTMIPAAAQATETITALRVPFSRSFKNSPGPMRVSLRIIVTMKTETTPANPTIMGL